MMTKARPLHDGGYSGLINYDIEGAMRGPWKAVMGAGWRAMLRSPAA